MVSGRGFVCWVFVGLLTKRDLLPGQARREIEIPSVLVAFAFPFPLPSESDLVSNDNLPFSGYLAAPVGAVSSRTWRCQ